MDLHIRKLSFLSFITWGSDEQERNWPFLACILKLEAVTYTSCSCREDWKVAISLSECNVGTLLRFKTTEVLLS